MQSCNYYLDFLVIAVLTSESVQFSRSVVSDSVTPWTTAHQASLYITNSQSLLKLMSVESVMPSNHFILCHPLLLPTSTFPRIRVFSNESALRIRWPKYWSFSFNISPSNEQPGLISFSMDWLDLLGPRSGVVAETSYPTSEVRGSSQDELPHVQGLAAAWVQEGREGLLHVQGQEGRPSLR